MKIHYCNIILWHPISQLPTSVKLLSWHFSIRYHGGTKLCNKNMELIMQKVKKGNMRQISVQGKYGTKKSF